MGYLEIWNEMDTVAYPVTVRRDAEGERREPRESGRYAGPVAGCLSPPAGRILGTPGGSPLRSQIHPDNSRDKVIATMCVMEPGI